ncbi:MAG: GNAT family N-acetyltransferase [Thiothrix sp.]|nr:GNAT family N-acetyltransferase [Thiothrix sp.]HPQ94296.1 GNAT family N-acetyltransferase [Thiolinea sp.]
MSAISLRTVTGTQLEPYLDALAHLRMQVFRDFPYLYDGNLAYEQRYLQTYLQSPEAAIVLALDGEQVVGASSCIPMRDEDAAFQRPFREQGRVLLGADFSLERLFYCAESVLDARYRGRGLGVAFFREREAHAARLGGFSHACFCAVERTPDHPLRPADYVTLDRFWNQRGYWRYPQLQTEFRWKDIDQALETAKIMTFWIKVLPV